MATISINFLVDEAEIATNVYEGIFRSSSPWCHKFSWDHTDPEQLVPVTYENPDADGELTKLVSPAELANGLQIAIRKGYHHCGCPVTTDYDNWDSCASDIVLQCAIFGKLVYG